MLARVSDLSFVHALVTNSNTHTSRVAKSLLNTLYCKNSIMMESCGAELFHLFWTDADKIRNLMYGWKHIVWIVFFHFYFPEPISIVSRLTLLASTSHRYVSVLHTNLGCQQWSMHIRWFAWSRIASTIYERYWRCVYTSFKFSL